MNKMYQSYFKESESNEATEFAQEIKDTIEKILSGFGIFIKFDTGFKPSISINIRIGKDKSEWNSGIAGNDPLTAQLSIFDGINKDGSLDKEMILEPQRSFVNTKPESSMYAFGSVKIPVRKTKGDKKKILQTIAKYAMTIKDTMKNVKSKDLVHPLHTKIFKKIK